MELSKRLKCGNGSGSGSYKTWDRNGVCANQALVSNRLSGGFTPYCIIIALYGFRIISNCERKISHRPKWRQKGFRRACYEINPSVRYGVHTPTYTYTYIELIFIYIIFKSGLAH